MKTEDQLNNNPEGKSCSCGELLQVVVDGQASEEQILYFKQHIEECPGCHSTYRIDTTIQSLIRSKCCGSQPPVDLIDQIKEKIRHIS